MPNSRGSLAHEAIYDPVKAHEYYIKNRDLKGRKPKASDLKTDKQKQGFDYVQSKIRETEKANLTKASEAHKAAVEQLRAKVQQRRQELAEKIQKIFDDLAKKSVTDRAQLTSATQAKINAIPPVPKGLSRERTAALAADRAEKIARIRGDAQAESDKIGEGVANTKNQVRDFSQKAREGMANELKAGIDQARKNYETLKAAIKDKSERDLNREFETLKTVQ